MERKKWLDFIEEKEIDKKIDSAKDKVGEISTSIRDKMIVDRISTVDSLEIN